MSDTNAEEQLRGELERLRQELEEKDKTLHLAAQYGNELLERNGDLTQELEKNNREFANKLEVLEQEKYSLQLKVSQKGNLEDAYADDIETLRSALSKEKEMHQTQIETEYVPRISSLNQQVNGLHLEVEKHQKLEQQLRDELKQQQVIIEDYKAELDRKMEVLNETCSEDMAQLQADVNKLQTEKLEHVSELTSAKNSLQRLKLEMHSLKETLALKEQDVEERQCQATSYYNALERSREECQELKVELDMTKMDCQDMKKKGNSLFGEVEDKRVEVEKKMITLRVKYESLQKQHEFARQQLQKMKMQMATLFMMSGGQADEQHMERQQHNLSQARAEIETLVQKIAELEKREILQREELKMAAASSGDKKYAEYLLARLDCKEEEIDRIKKELNTTRLLQLGEAQKLLQCERQLHTVERERETLRGAVMKIKVELEEMKMKYEPDSLKGCRKNRVIKEKIPIQKPAEVPAEEEGETKENAASDDPDQALSDTEQADKETDRDTEPKSRRKRVILANRPVIEERIPKAGAAAGALKSCLKDAGGKKSYAASQRDGLDIRGRPTSRQGKTAGPITEEDCKVQ